MSFCNYICENVLRVLCIVFASLHPKNILVIERVQQRFNSLIPKMMDLHEEKMIRLSIYLAHRVRRMKNDVIEAYIILGGSREWMHG